MSKVITRFAPSPTGKFHLGSARTALFNYLYAACNNGIFKIRIEDTDVKRCKSEYTCNILNGIKWLNLQHDKSILFQSERKAIYMQYVQYLLKNKKAYFCQCECKVQNCCFTKNLNSGSVRMFIHADKELFILDKIRGKIKMSLADMNNFTIMRSDFSPTYHICVVVDDYLSHVSHIIRGDDHLSNTFKHKLLYEALNFNIPTYIHLPLIHDESGKKLSKRSNFSLNIDDFKKEGFIFEGINNYLLRLGWSFGDKEIFTTEESIKLFNIQNINKSPCKFNYDKMIYLNHKQLLLKSNEEIYKLLLPFLKNICDQSKKSVYLAIDILKYRCKTLREMANQADIYTSNFINKSTLVYSEKKIAHLYCENIDNFKWSAEIIKENTFKWAQEKNIDIKKLCYILRKCLTGSSESPNIFQIMFALGREVCLQRIKNVKSS